MRAITRNGKQADMGRGTLGARTDTEGCRHTARRRRGACGALLCAALSWGPATLVHAGSPQVPQELRSASHQVAQVVLGILRYARWPGDTADIQLCVLGATRYADVLLQTPSHAGQRVVQVRRMAWEATAAGDCDAVYVGALTGPQNQAVNRQLVGHPVLAISEVESGCDDGLAFCLVVDAEQTGFRTNPRALAVSGVRVHPSVLKLARNRTGAP